MSEPTPSAMNERVRQMRKLLLTTALLGAVGMSPAMAADRALTLWNDANPGGAVTATGTGSAVISGLEPRRHHHLDQRCAAPPCPANR